jgi:hypothetical protein
MEIDGQNAQFVPSPPQSEPLASASVESGANAEPKTSLDEEMQSPRGSPSDLSSYRVEVLLSDGVGPMRKVGEGNNLDMDLLPFIGENICPELCQVHPLTHITNSVSLETIDSCLSAVLQNYGKDGGSMNTAPKTDVDGDSD